MTVLVLLASGIVEFASLFTSTIDTTSGIRSAARVGAGPGATGTTDDYTILHVALDRVGGRRTGITKVVVFRANSAQKQPPGVCLTQSTPPSGVACNIYGPANFDQSHDALLASPQAQGWPVSARKPGEDFIGVWVNVVRTPLMPVPGSRSTYQDVFTMKMLSPGATGSTTAGSTMSTPPGSGMSGPVGDNLGWGGDAWNCWGTRGCFTGSGPDSDGTSVGTGGAG